MLEQEWTILNESGERPVSFTSFFDIEYQNKGEALTYPVEEGAFANYNKVQNPGNIKVTLGTQGTERDFSLILDVLDIYQKEAEKLFISTPAAYYDGYTLESYSYRRTIQSGAGTLIVSLTLVEVREVETQTTTTVITKPKNPTSSSKVNTGKTQPEEPGKKDVETAKKQSALKGLGL
ncbi:MAG: hypothetical protein LBV79_10330 [Candidatus Adiutrix sp.]|jgi:hypothetical protein|nr:hypothetical protein [Candidatus Adiutrix sp.]